jgi:hypothetical protein
MLDTTIIFIIRRRRRRRRQAKRERVLRRPVISAPLPLIDSVAVEPPPPVPTWAFFPDLH